MDAAEPSWMKFEADRTSPNGSIRSSLQGSEGEAPSVQHCAGCGAKRLGKSIICIKCEQMFPSDGASVVLQQCQGSGNTAPVISSVESKPSPRNPFVKTGAEGSSAKFGSAGPPRRVADLQAVDPVAAPVVSEPSSHGQRQPVLPGRQQPMPAGSNDVGWAAAQRNSSDFQSVPTVPVDGQSDSLHASLARSEQCSIVDLTPVPPPPTQVPVEVGVRKMQPAGHPRLFDIGVTLTREGSGEFEVSSQAECISHGVTMQGIIEIGDKVESINGERLRAGMGVVEAMECMCGPEGTMVLLELQKAGAVETLSLSLVRKCPLPLPPSNDPPPPPPPPPAPPEAAAAGRGGAEEDAAMSPHGHRVGTITVEQLIAIGVTDPE
eukprot:CAMPEP_0181324754 /NCGR_PEP_ID=MMETSP1101-20121128/20541_1 /TAXON_ID=46948 /ORGANISM="Rhodomonas abbreviata, Strain Caron Lab Isolate" /LENGTH=377 /DNA_ID=CAMNT_0023432977 /DNA_START=176 /DNA_END=1306 /DNA_ORIENTATION=+